MMSSDLTADDVLRLLDLEPNATCGFVRETLRLGQAISPGGLPAPFADGRPLGTALYFMVTPAAPVRLHRIRNDQLYHYYLGDPIEVLLLNADGTSEHVIVGPDLRAGHRVQLLIPGDTFHTARIIGTRKFFLVPALNGRACCRSTSSSATGRRWRRNIRMSPPISAAFRTRLRNSGPPPPAEDVSDADQTSR